MSPELDRQLCERYPLIFKDRHASMQVTAMCWGFDHGDGWFHILDVLCAARYGPYEQAVQSYEFARKHEGTSPWKGAGHARPWSPPAGSAICCNWGVASVWICTHCYPRRVRVWYRPSFALK